jgi:predicted nicotinamide N-methyase
VDHRLFDPAVAATISVLELGTGTGILPVLLQRSHSLTQGTTKQSQLPLHTAVFRSWTATDQYDNLKLVRKNLRLNGLEDTPSVNIAELDWLNVRPPRAGDGNEELYDAIVAVDCLYNEALVAPFVRTLDRYAILGKTTVYVLVELRSSDVVSTEEIWLRAVRI